MTHLLRYLRRLKPKASICLDVFDSGERRVVTITAPWVK